MLQLLISYSVHVPKIMTVGSQLVDKFIATIKWLTFCPPPLHITGWNLEV